MQVHLLGRQPAIKFPPPSYSASNHPLWLSSSGNNLINLILLLQASSVGCEKPAENMVFFCFLVDQKRRIRRSKPAAGICSRCGGGASVADIKTETRFCYVPFYWKHWRAIICTFCGAVLKTYANIIV